MENLVLDKVKKLGREKYPEAEISLFGSRARGTANAQSDWDILIVMPDKKISFDREGEIMNDFFNIEIETGANIVPYIIARNHWTKTNEISPLFQNIKKEGMKLQ